MGCREHLQVPKKRRHITSASLALASWSCIINQHLRLPSKPVDWLQTAMSSAGWDTVPAGMRSIAFESVLWSPGSTETSLIPSRS